MGARARFGSTMSRTSSYHQFVAEHVTPRDLEVLRAYGEEELYTRAAHRLGIKPNTVRNHLSRLYRLLDVEGATGAYKVLGWLQIPQERGR
jgi:DNA-binding NarL/FixJ family response regulator